MSRTRHARGVVRIRNGRLTRACEWCGRECIDAVERRGRFLARREAMGSVDEGMSEWERMGPCERAGRCLYDEGEDCPLERDRYQYAMRRAFEAWPAGLYRPPSR